MTAKIETEFIFETNIYFISAQKTVTFLAISKLLQYHTSDEIRWNPHLCRCQEAYKPFKHILGDIKVGWELCNSCAIFLFVSEFHFFILLHVLTY